MVGARVDAVLEETLDALEDADPVDEATETEEAVVVAEADGSDEGAEEEVIVAVALYWELDAAAC